VSILLPGREKGVARVRVDITCIPALWYQAISQLETTPIEKPYFMIDCSVVHVVEGIDTPTYVRSSGSTTNRENKSTDHDAREAKCDISEHRSKMRALAHNWLVLTSRTLWSINYTKTFKS
jgi:hypothetical protein